MATRTKNFARYERVKIDFTREQLGYPVEGVQGTIEWQVPADSSNHDESERGKWLVKLDRKIRVSSPDRRRFQRDEEDRFYVDADQITRLARRQDHAFKSFQRREIENLMRDHGPAFVRDALQAQLAALAELDELCLRGQHDWGKPHGGYGGANERQDCQRAGCTAHMYD